MNLAQKTLLIVLCGFFTQGAFLLGGAWLFDVQNQPDPLRALLPIVLLSGVCWPLVWLLMQSTVIAPWTQFLLHVSNASTVNQNIAPVVDRKDELGRMAQRFHDLWNQVRETTGRHDLFEATITHVGDATAILDHEFVIRYVNPAYEELTGRSADEVIGRKPSGGRADPETYEDLIDTVNSGRKWTGVLHSQRAEGMLSAEEVTVAPIFNDKSEITHFVAVFRDVTEMLNNQLELRRLATAVESAADSIAMIDRDGTLVYLNSAYERRSGFDRTQLIGRKPSELQFGKNDDQLYYDLWRRVRSGKTWTGRMNIENRDKSVMENDVTVSPVLDGSETISGYVIVMRDIQEAGGRPLSSLASVTTQ